MILCSCNNLNDKFIKAAIEENAEAVQNETTDKRAAAVVWRATHPPAADGHHKQHCGTCIGHICEAIEEMGLRPKAKSANTNICGTSGHSCAAPCLSA